MSDVRILVLGFALGIVGALPPVIMFELALREVRPVGVGAGLASIAISFFALAAAVFVVRLVSPADTLFFGTAEAVSFLLVWVVEAWRGWRGAQHGSSGERNRGEPTG